MQILKQVTGPGSGPIKYDILTALLVTSARGDAVTARLALRLSLLITARFNWRRGTFTVGQREMARMWGVTERTAKREMAHMREKRWISVTIPAARGRVAQYRIEMAAVLKDTMPHWDAVGPDFASRMTGAPEAGERPLSNVVPLRRDAPDTLPDTDNSGWHLAAARLRDQDSAIYSAWLGSLLVVDVVQGVMTLMAPNRFQADYVRTHFLTRILAAIVSENRDVREVQIEAPR